MQYSDIHQPYPLIGSLYISPPDLQPPSPRRVPQSILKKPKGDSSAKLNSTNSVVSYHSVQNPHDQLLCRKKRDRRAWRREKRGKLLKQSRQMQEIKIMSNRKHSRSGSRDMIALAPYNKAGSRYLEEDGNVISMEDVRAHNQSKLLQQQQSPSFAGRKSGSKLEAIFETPQQKTPGFNEGKGNLSPRTVIINGQQIVIGGTEDPLTCQMSINSEEEQQLLAENEAAMTTFRKNLEKTQQLLDNVMDDDNRRGSDGVRRITENLTEYGLSAPQRSESLGPNKSWQALLGGLHQRAGTPLAKNIQPNHSSQLELSSSASKRRPDLQRTPPLSLKKPIYKGNQGVIEASKLKLSSPSNNKKAPITKAAPPRKSAQQQKPVKVDQKPKERSKEISPQPKQANTTTANDNNNVKPTYLHPAINQQYERKQKQNIKEEANIQGTTTGSVIEVKKIQKRTTSQLRQVSGERAVSMLRQKNIIVQRPLTELQIADDSRAGKSQSVKARHPQSINAVIQGEPTLQMESMSTKNVVPRVPKLSGDYLEKLKVKMDLVRQGQIHTTEWGLQNGGDSPSARQRAIEYHKRLQLNRNTQKNSPDASVEYSGRSHHNNSVGNVKGHPNEWFSTMMQQEIHKVHIGTRKDKEMDEMKRYLQDHREHYYQTLYFAGPNRNTNRRATAGTQRSSNSPPKNQYSPNGTLILNKDSARGHYNVENDINTLPNESIGRTIETELFDDEDTQLRNISSIESASNRHQNSTRTKSQFSKPQALLMPVFVPNHVFGKKHRKYLTTTFQAQIDKSSAGGGGFNIEAAETSLEMPPSLNGSGGYVGKISKGIEKPQMNLMALDLGLVNAHKSGKTHFRAKSSPKASRFPNGLNPLFVPGLMGLKNGGIPDLSQADYKKKYTMPSSKPRLHNHSSGVLSHVPSSDIKAVGGEDVQVVNNGINPTDVSPLETSDHLSQKRLLKQTQLYTNTQYLDSKFASINVYSKKASLPNQVPWGLSTGGSGSNPRGAKLSSLTQREMAQGPLQLPSDYQAIANIINSQLQALSPPTHYPQVVNSKKLYARTNHTFFSHFS
ncbi:hypothetical protein FGO68_gene7092 [Halteria grandinella]|uniref:Uncharacterized protein n=1 Tax=Halteria grandinella TaxID=5974 RepID=A0A8J8P3F4_HALGN|nr:hypothetical protein FGO68_gene7092 [Halteria grandinella]